MYYEIILKSKASFLDTMFTYEYNEEINPGVRVVVPFGNGNEKTIGIVIRKNEAQIDFDVKKIVEVIDIKPIISEEMINLALFMVENNLSDYSSAINTILPPGEFNDIREFYLSSNETTIDNELKEFLKEPKTFEEIYTQFGNKYKISNINHFVNEGKITSFFDYTNKASIKYEELVSLNNKNWENLINKNAKTQLKILNKLSEVEFIEKSHLLSELKTSNSVLKSLIDKELVKIEKKRIFRKVLSKVEEYSKHILNSEQQKAYEKIVNSKESKFLIHGVTGSGKTEIYLQLVEYYISLGKQAIILVPEISLTPQTIARFQGRFGDNIAVLHSRLNISERADQWKLIKNGDVKIVVGARSAIFAPFENLGIIIIDEEHETSYKSDKNPKYSAIEIAFERMRYQNINVVLGSATPSIKSMYEVYKKNIQLILLQNRVNDLKLPEVEIVDMREELKNNNFSMFSKSLKSKILEAKSRGEQSILFLNKRGHTSFVFCRSCGYVHKCEACDVAMTYHKSYDRLICHYCGRTAFKTKSCKNCGSKFIKEYGAGTEMLEEQAKIEFPNMKIVRMDADTVSKKNDYEKIYSQMKNGEIDILIGTQMLAKGLDFPNVSVVGIVSADISLNIPDFRASEKTYGLITQVSGRAGRGNTKGDVIIQTYNPDNFAIVNAANNDYYKFYNLEMNERKMFFYPPFVNILKINLSSIDRSEGVKVGQRLMIKINNYLRENNENLIEMTGPTPGIISRINNRFKFDIIVKSIDVKLLKDIANYLRKINKYDNNVYINYMLEVE